MTTQLMKVEGIAKGFPGVQALSDVRFELDYGEVLALVGENGAGKSTLMKILSGIYEKDAGTIYLDGEPVEIDGPKQAQELGISIIHQEMNLMPHLTVAQNIYIGREPRHFFGLFVDERALNKKTQTLLDELGIALDAHTPIENLTVAKQQMVEIAKALSFDAKVLIMDEPTSALTTVETDTLFRLILDLKRKGKTGIVYISHRMEELKVISDRITVLRDGHYVDTMRTEDTNSKHVISLMVGREIDESARPVVPTGEHETVLRVEGLNTKKLLRDVNFELKRGEILGFAGLMGAGRTEVARAIIGADPIESGTIQIDGKQVSIGSPADAVRNGIGYLSEDRKQFGLLLEQDVNTNILLSSLSDYAGVLGFMQQDKGKATSRSFVKSLKIKTPSIFQTTKNLSGGNQQKIVIAKWLAKDCDILIFDEPTRGIDVGAKEEIYKLLNELVAQGKSIIMISSELPEILRMSHRIVVMSQGVVTGTLDNADADQAKIMDYATRLGD